jgi:hypothetical protein
LRFRKHTLLPLDDCLYALQATIPQLLHRCLDRHGISRLPELECGKPSRKKFDSHPIGFFHIDLAEVRTSEGKLYLFVAIDRTSKFRWGRTRERPIYERPRTSSTRSSRLFRIASTLCSPTTVSISLTCRRTCHLHGIEHRPSLSRAIYGRTNRSCHAAPASTFRELSQSWPVRCRPTTSDALSPLLSGNRGSN